MIWVGLLSLVTMTLFATLNVALRTPSRGRIAEQFERSRGEGAFERFVARRPRYILSTAIMRSAAVTFLFFAVLYSADSGEPVWLLMRNVVACLIAFGLIVVFGVAIPYAWAKYAGEWLVVRCLSLLIFSSLLTRPAIVLVEIFDPVVRRLAGVPVRDTQSYADELEREILNVVSEGEIHGAVDEEEKEMIESVIEMGDKRVEEIMTPRTEIVALPAETDLDTTLDTIREKGYSRIPVYDESVDTILGVVYAKDLLRRTADGPFDLRTVMRKPFFIPESKLVPDLLRELQKQKVQIAIVLDEYGGTAGLITVEDILEELVGELEDEYDTSSPVAIKRIDDTTYEVDARMRIDDLADELGIELPDDQDYETIGGFVFSTLGRIPKVGETCDYNNVSFRVIAAEPRRIRRLLLKISPVTQPDGAER